MFPINLKEAKYRSPDLLLSGMMLILYGSSEYPLPFSVCKHFALRNERLCLEERKVIHSGGNCVHLCLEERKVPGGTRGY